MALRPGALLKGAVICTGAFLVMLALAYGSSEARWLDASALQGFLGLQGGRVSPITERLGSLGDPLPVVVAVGVLAAIALARGRPRVAFLVLLFVGLTSISSQALKALLAYPRSDEVVNGAHIAPAAFPSGHATASMTVALALVIVAAPRLRPVAALVGSALALAVSFSVVSRGWHFPSDVIGGFLLATGWALVLLAGLRAADGRFPQRTGRGTLVRPVRATVDLLAGVGLVAVLIGGVILVVGLIVAAVAFRPPDLVGYAQDHTAFIVVATLLGLSAVALLGGLASVLARRG
ncbi:MAG: phosphatase PAP2 family protein [Thermoleophilaceae bacterium]